MTEDGAGGDEHGETAIFEAAETAPADLETATEQVRNLLTLAHVAALNRRPAAAEHWRRCSERAALRTVLFSLLRRVLRPSPMP